MKPSASWAVRQRPLLGLIRVVHCWLRTVVGEFREVLVKPREFVGSWASAIGFPGGGRLGGGIRVPYSEVERILSGNQGWGNTCNRLCSCKASPDQKRGLERRAQHLLQYCSG